MDRIVYYVFVALASLIALTVHEFSHGYIAYRLGDPTARAMGRLSLNPIKHLDPVGAICMIVFRFGWARPVPIDPRYFKRPKRDFALCALAGPLSNLILAVLSGFLYSLLLSVFGGIQFTNAFLFELCQNLLNFLFIFHYVNLGLTVFNLIPVPPLDGSRILNVILPDRIYFRIMRYERKIYLGLIIWLLVGDFIRDALLNIPFIASNPILSGITVILSLSDLIGLAIQGLSDLILGLFSLIFN